MDTFQTDRHGAPQPIQDGKGATDPGPRNVPRDRENLDVLVPPETDRGTLPNLKFSFAEAHNRLEPGGWARQVTVRELPIATTLAGVNMRLSAGAVRELHWHKQAEWAYMLYGSARITALDEQGGQFADDIHQGDLWYFPAGFPHSIQGLGPDGCEFLLVFDEGTFSEDSTFLITDWTAHTPRDVLASNFGWDKAAFDAIPQKEKYIFPADIPGPLEGNKIGPRSRENFSFRLHEQTPQKTAGGTVRIADSRNFPVSKTVAAALVDVEPGGMRELHWHPQADEWQYYIRGEARMTVFASEGKARTFDYRAGDVGYVPHAMGHYIQNTGDTTLTFLEMFRSDRFADFSLKQWMALSPHELVQAHLQLDRALIDSLPQEKVPVVPGKGKV